MERIQDGIYIGRAKDAIAASKYDDVLKNIALLSTPKTQLSTLSDLLLNYAMDESSILLLDHIKDKSSIRVCMTTDKNEYEAACDTCDLNSDIITVWPMLLDPVSGEVVKGLEEFLNAVLHPNNPLLARFNELSSKYSQA